MNRKSTRVAGVAAFTALTLVAAASLVRAQATGGVTPPTVPSGNALNDTGSNMQGTTNNANAAAGGGTLDNTVNSASTATKDTTDKLKADADAAGAGTPTADNPAPDAKNIRKALGKVAGEALEKGDLDDLVALLSEADRDRIKKSDSYDQSYGEKLDGRIDEIQKAWTSKYGHAFELKHANKMFGDSFAAIQQGQVGKDADLFTVVKSIGGDDTNLEAGRAIALVSVAPSHGLPELKVALVHELPDTWKIDVPNDVDASKLRKNLLDHLTALGQHTADWPADESEAYRAVTHVVLMAVMNKPVQWQTAQVPEPVDSAAAADTGKTEK